MPDVEHYELLILGGGKAGKTLAMDMAQAGHGVALIERGLIGGSCINIACIPAKTMIRSAQVARLVRERGSFGLQSGPTKVDMAMVAARTASVVAGMVEDHTKLFAESGFELVIGEGRFAGSRTVEVCHQDGSTRHMTGARIFLDLGTRAAVPPIPGLRAAAPLTHVEALRLARLPAHLLVLGGGYVGLELAQAFRHLGSFVTIIERGGQLLGREDADMAAAILDLCRGDGIAVYLDTTVEAVEGRSGDEVRVRLSNKDGPLTLTGSDILVAAGRVPQTAGIGLEQAGVRVNAAGFIAVDEHLATSAPGIWAMGEAAGSPMFTHVALDDYRVARSVILGGDRTTRSRLVPYAVFLEPEFARVGLGEAEARADGLDVRVVTLPMAKVPRARTLSETRGLMKAIIGADDRILGFAMLGAQAGEIVAVVQTAMWGRLSYTAFRDGIIAHPTIAEGLNLLFAKVPDHAD